MSKKPDQVTKDKAKDFMMGNLILLVIQKLKAMPEVWKKLPEAEQQSFIEMVKADVEVEVKAAVETIASDHRACLQGDVESVTFKDGIKVIIKIGKDAAERHELADVQGKSVYIVLPHLEKFLQGKTPVADKDQHSLIPGEKSE